MRNLFTLIALVLPLSLGAQQPYSVRMAESRGLTLLQDTWDGTQGMLAHALCAVTAKHADATAVTERLTAYLSQVLDEDGNVKDFQKGAMENMMPGRALLDRYAQQEDARLKNGFNFLHTYLVLSYPRIKKTAGKTGFIHADDFPNQMWLQDFYQGLTFYAQWLQTCDVNNRAAWKDLAVQFLTYQQQAYNPIHGLYPPHWSADPGSENAFWAIRQGVFKGSSRIFTAQSTGYLLAALVDVLEMMPPKMAGYNQLREMLEQVADGVLCWQDTDSGCWYQILNADSSTRGECGETNYLESSGSALLTYGLLKGVRCHLLDEDRYAAAAHKAYQGLLQQFLTEEEDGTLTLKDATGYTGIGNSAQMQRDGSVDYYLCGEGTQKCDNEPKAVAAFILASLENENTQE